MSANELSTLSPEAQLAFAKQQFEIVSKAIADEENYLAMEQNLVSAITIFEAQHQTEDYVLANCILAQIFMGKDEYNGAENVLLKLFDFAVQQRGDKHAITGEVHYTLSTLYAHTSRFELALVHINQYLAIAQIPDNFAKNPSSAYNALAFSANIYESLFDINKAIERAEEAFDLGNKLWGHQTTGELIWGDKAIDYANACYGISRVYQSKGDYDKSLTYARQGQHLISLTLGNEHHINYYFYHNMGITHLSLGDLNTALIYFKKNITLNKEAAPKSKHLRSITYHDLANVYTELKDYPKALNYYDKAIILSEELFSATNTAIAYFLVCKASAHYNLGNLQAAVSCVEKALEIYRINQIEKSLEVASAYHNLSKYVSDVQLKQNYLQKAIDIQLTLKGFNPSTTANFYCELAQHHANQQHYIVALETIQKAIHYTYEKYESKDIYTLPTVLADCISPAHLLDIFMEHGAILLQHFEATQTIQSVETAIKVYELGCQLIDQLRQSYQTNASKINLGKKAIKIYEGGIWAIEAARTHLAITGMHPLAFYFFEKAKGSLLLSALQDSLAKTSTDIPKKLLTEEQQLQIELTYLEKSIQQQKTKETNKNEALIQQWQSEFFDYHQQHQALLKKLETDYPNYYQLKYDTQTVNVEQLQNSLKPQQIMISYFISSTHIHIFAIGSQIAEQVSIVQPPNFEKMIKRFLKSINQLRYAKYVALGKQLYDLLIAPIQKHLPSSSNNNISKLIIIPHGLLSYLPFEALICSEAPTPTPGISSYYGIDYLLNHFEISYHYSATLWHYQQQKTPSEAIATPSHSFVGFAPVYDVASETTAKVLQTTAESCRSWVTRSDAIRGDGTWASLPYSETEVKNIEQLFANKGLDANTYLRGEATKVRFTQNAQNAKYILIAAHGLLNDENTALSGLVFYPEEAQASEHKTTATTSSKEERSASTNVNTDTTANNTASADPILSMEETYHLNLNADLVVLSSCDSGIGTLVKGEGMMAVNRGFIHAGAKNLISTLFKVYDKPSSLLTQYLFEAILAGDTYSAALRKAKLRLMEMEGVNPKSWCGFVLIGKG